MLLLLLLLLFLLRSSRRCSTYSFVMVLLDWTRPCRVVLHCSHGSVLGLMHNTLRIFRHCHHRAIHTVLIRRDMAFKVSWKRWGHLLPWHHTLATVGISTLVPTNRSKGAHWTARSLLLVFLNDGAVITYGGLSYELLVSGWRIRSQEI